MGGSHQLLEGISALVVLTPGVKGMPRLGWGQASLALVFGGKSVFYSGGLSVFSPFCERQCQLWRVEGGKDARDG